MIVRYAKIFAAMAVLALPAAAQAQEKMTFLSSWRAQAEHGGYYQAVAKGLYRACGLDVSIRMGGPGTDTKALLAGGAVDGIMGSFTDDPFRLNEAGFPAQAVMASFQKTPQILMTHPGNGINTLADMRGKPIMIGQGSRVTFWPFLRARYGFTDAQIRAYNFQMGPWLVDRNAIQQGFVSSEPFKVRTEGNIEPTVFMLSDLGYLSYSSMPIFPTKTIREKPRAIQCFVDATILGWIDYFKDPAPANALIKRDNPDNTDALIAYAIEKMKQYGIVETEETKRLGIGTMSEDRFRGHFEMMRDEGLYKADFNWRSAFTLDFVNKRFGL